MPSLAGSGTGDSSPVLRTASLSISDHTDIDALRLDYGINLETVSYLRRVMAASPFARASYDLGSDGMLRAAFSAGTRPAQLISKDGQIDGVDYNADLAALALLPRVSRRDRHMRMERLKAFELGWERSSGSRKFSANVYREEIADAAFTLSGAQGPALWTDLLPDLDSRSFVFNAGDLYRTGFEGAFTQSLGENIDITAAAGRGGALVSSGQDAGSSRASDIRSTLHQEQRSWATLRASAKIRTLNTKLVTSYGWTDFRALLPVHYSLTEKTYQDMGWNAYIRQPLPIFGGLPGRLEISAEILNLLAQGYLPIQANGRRSILTNSPRALRGGLSIIF